MQAFLSRPQAGLAILTTNPREIFMKPEKTALIRALNDLLRQMRTGGTINITAGVAARGQMFVALAIKAMSQANQFDADNDPYGEHDFGAIEVEGCRLFWKIDYYDPSFAAGAEDPSDSETCARVLTLMLAEEY